MLRYLLVVVNIASVFCKTGINTTEVYRSGRSLLTSTSSVCRILPSEGHSWCWSGSDNKGTKYFYDYKTKECLSFYYYGCGGNDNRFDSKRQCYNKCNPKPKNDCSSKPHPGKKCGSRGARPGYRVYYDPKDKTCRRFDYLGCGGNHNNFENYLICEHKCGHKKSIKETVKHKACHLPLHKGSKPCGESSDLRYYFDTQQLKCLNFEYSGCDGNANNFRFIKTCEERCGARKPGPSLKHILNERRKRICKLRYRRGEYCVNSYGDDIKRSVKSFHWNDGLGKCEMFYYKGCKGNDNRFDSATKCSQFCYGS